MPFHAFTSFCCFSYSFSLQIHKDGISHRQELFQTWSQNTMFCYLAIRNVWSFGVAIDLAKGGLVHDFMSSWHAFSRSRLQVGGSPHQWSNSSEVGEFGFGRPHSKACCLLCSEALTQILQKNLGIQSLNAADSHLHMISICKVGKS